MLVATLTLKALSVSREISKSHFRSWAKQARLELTLNPSERRVFACLSNLHCSVTTYSIGWQQKKNCPFFISLFFAGPPLFGRISARRPPEHPYEHGGRRTNGAEMHDRQTQRKMPILICCSNVHMLYVHILLHLVCMRQRESRVSLLLQWRRRGGSHNVKVIRHHRMIMQQIHGQIKAGFAPRLQMC